MATFPGPSGAEDSALSFHGLRSAAWGGSASPVATFPGPFGAEDSALRPDGAMECSHGWSDAALGVAEPVESMTNQQARPEGAEERPREKPAQRINHFAHGGGCFAKNALSPSRHSSPRRGSALARANSSIVSA